jgi:hypothetical protein
MRMIREVDGWVVEGGGGGEVDGDRGRAGSPWIAEMRWQGLAT